MTKMDAMINDNGQASTMATVLAVAGSDPSGGAGIQADIKTITMLGGYAAAAITALTVQNSVAVQQVVPQSGQFVNDQVTAVIKDMKINVIKTGMLVNADVMAGLLSALSDGDYQGRLVVDPVMVASRGQHLLDEAALDFFIEAVLPKVDLLTPNIPEAAVLTGLSIETVADMQRAAEQLLTMGAGHVLLKGGHLIGDEAVDILLGNGGQQGEHTRLLVMRRKKIKTKHTHGTGCTLASAMATGLAQGLTWADNFKRATDFTAQAILGAPQLGRGNGPLDHTLGGHALVDHTVVDHTVADHRQNIKISDE